jgi:hypothetical protein
VKLLSSHNHVIDKSGPELFQPQWWPAIVSDEATFGTEK